MDMREDTELTLVVDRLAFGGKGVARVDGLVVFVDGGLPGATVRAKVTKVKKGFAEALVVETLTVAPQAVAAPCPHFGVCGGCLHQDLDYAAQLFWKRQQVAETLSRLGGLRDVDVAPVVASPDIYGYRNKMEFAFAGRLHLGLHERQRPGRVLDIENCLLMDDRVGDILAFVRETCADTGLAAYDPRTGKGVWRHLVLRRSLATGGRLVHLITAPSRRAGDAAQHLGESLLERFPDVSGFVHSVRRNPMAVAIGERQISALGADHLEERIGEVRLRISADAFAQTNTRAAEKLYAEVARAAGSAPDRALWDVYCGCGGIALALAPGFETVYGVEADKRAVADARKAAKSSGRDNCVFKAGDAATVLADLAATKPAVVTIDPPRAGVDGQTLAAVMDAAPDKLVYVSCNPATLARDLKTLSDLYTLNQVTPVDLFPHTAHIEVVAALELRK
ncbi:23S rRNA (uracil(1939)-C(5))-methyltransferase RlmD [Solidesulfovibrio sp. C21]|uniref:23S rRNA (uracil(1939)-C(5))-methyltransferase RlmD n=1 Tax=Solidesulfovibrio sp. C21 TaxID=3398613 RepID=UPI0039FC38A4